MELLCHKVRVCNFIRNCQTVFQSGCAILHSSQRGKVPDVSLLTKIQLSVFLNLAMLVCMKWYLITFLSCISLMTTDLNSSSCAYSSYFMKCQVVCSLLNGVLNAHPLSHMYHETFLPGTKIVCIFFLNIYLMSRPFSFDCYFLLCLVFSGFCLISLCLS